MRDQAVVAVNQLAVAHKRARQLRRELSRLNETVPAAHENWQDLMEDVEAIERRLDGALHAVIGVFHSDPSEYIRPPKRM